MYETLKLFVNIVFLLKTLRLYVKIVVIQMHLPWFRKTGTLCAKGRLWVFFSFC